MSLWIKICGVTRPEDAELAMQLGADAIGFVMHAPSLRRCEIETARAMIRNLPVSTSSVGVWFDETAEEIAPLAKEIGCKMVQTYDLAAARKLKARGFNVLCALAMPIEHAVLDEFSFGDCVIFDAGRRHPKSHADSSTSKAIESDMSAWSGLRVAVSLNDTKLIFAGGLNCENIHAALDEFRPDGVDVASGLESAPGIKDREKMIRFMEVGREWSEKASSARTGVDSYPKR